jgi:hypothetical protein
MDATDSDRTIRLVYSHKSVEHDAITKGLLAELRRHYKNGFAGLDITITEARALHAGLGLSIGASEAANADDEE